MGNTPNRNVRIEDELWEAAGNAAKANGENLSVVIRRALISYAQMPARPDLYLVEATYAPKHLDLLPEEARAHIDRRVRFTRQWDIDAEAPRYGGQYAWVPEEPIGVGWVPSEDLEDITMVNP